MTTRRKEEVPDVLGGQAGTSEAKERHDEHSTPEPTIVPNALESNPQDSDRIVEAIRILARLGRQLREAKEAAERQVKDVDPGDCASPISSASTRMPDREARGTAVGEVRHTPQSEVCADCGLPEDAYNLAEAAHG